MALTEAHPTAGEGFDEAAPLIGAPPGYGPPIIFVLGPWLLLVLLLIPPAALLITLVLVVVVAGGLLVAVAALVASPYLLVRHAARRRRVASEHRAAPAGVSRGTLASPPVPAARPAQHLGEAVR